MAIKVYSITVGVSRYNTVDPMLPLPPPGNPITFHGEVEYLQPMIPPKRLTFSRLTWGCSEGLDAFRFFFKQQQLHLFTTLLIIPSVLLY